MGTISSLFALLVMNARTIAFVAGFAVLYVGVSGWSYRAANVTAGCLLMLMALVPYFLRRAE